MMKKVVLISGKQGSGKTTLASNLQEKLEKMGHPAAHLTFASVIYDIHDYAMKKLDLLGIERGIKKDGPLLQLLGTEWGRKTIGENIWVDCLKGEIINHQAMAAETGRAYPFIIVSDCRFKNEFDAFPDALSVRLECDKEVRKERCSMWRDRDDHPSEIDLDEYADRGLFTLQSHTDRMKSGDIADLVVEILSEWSEI